MLVAEIYLDAKSLFPFLMTDEQDVIVPGDGLHLGKPLLHPFDAVLEGADGNGKYLLEKYDPEFPIGVDEEQSFSAFSGGDEVAFHVPCTPFLVDMLGSFFDRSLVQYSRFRPSPPPSSCREFLPVRFDLPSVRTPDECPDGHSRDMGEVFLVFPYSLRYELGRLVIEEVLLDGFPELRMK